MKMMQRKKKFSYCSTKNATTKNVDKNTKRKYCLNRILDMKMKERKKNSLVRPGKNVTMKNVDKKKNNENILITQYRR